MSPTSHAHLILAYGDSLTAPYGIDAEQGWVHLLQERIHENNLPFDVINASISGATTYTGLAQLPKVLAIHKPQIILFGLGSNDGRLGLSTTAMKENLLAMINLAQEAEAKVLLIGFKLPINYGAFYREPFENVFIEIAEETNVPFVPFLLEGVALQEGFMLEDGLHPNAKAQPLILNNIWPYLKPLLIEYLDHGKNRTNK